MNNKQEKTQATTSDSLIRSATIVGGLNLVSRITGLARDMVWSALMFGASLDVFVLAFTIPNLFRQLLGEGALSSAFIPQFVGELESDNPKGAWLLAGRIVNLLFIVLCVIVLIVVGVSYIGVSFSELNSTSHNVFSLLPWMMPLALIICLTAICGGMLNSLNKFASFAFAPVMLNIACVIGGVFLLSNPTEDISKTMTWWVLGGATLGLLIQFPQLLFSGFRPVASLNWKNKSVQSVGRVMAPMAFGLAVTQINVALDRYLAMALVEQEGAVSALWLGARLMQLPLGIFSIAIATAAFPALSRDSSRKDKVALLKTLGLALRTTLFLAVPSVVGLIVLSEDIGRLLFMRGAVCDIAVERLSWVAIFYAPAMLFISIKIILVRVFYAERDVATPVRIGIITVVLNIILNIVLITVSDGFTINKAVSPSDTKGVNMHYTYTESKDVIHRNGRANISTNVITDVHRQDYQTIRFNGEIGVALATSISTFIAVVWMWVALRRRLGDMSETGFYASLSRHIVFGIIYAFWMTWLLRSFSPWDGSVADTWSRGIAPVVIGILTWPLLAGFFKEFFPEYDEVMGGLRRKRLKKNAS